MRRGSNLPIARQMYRQQASHRGPLRQSLRKTQHDVANLLGASGRWQGRWNGGMAEEIMLAKQGYNTVAQDEG